jgi:teichoic acid transport system ATP-binding protein
MNNNIAIKVENLTKIYHLYNTPQDRLKEALNPFKKSYHHDFYAMDNVSFEIKKGETVGILGKNGAGKSTLLKMITGVLTPSSGSIQTQGTIASLLELGAGFNPEMTGMENIFLNGTLMGFTKEQMEAKVDDILAFADIGEFIYQPVKMYSSGMFARLAFSVSINADPDILIIDEALSVGDMAFQMKCYKKFQDFQEAGKTILFVTHGLDTVIRYCSTGIVIDNGKLIFEDTSKLAVDAFKKVLSGDFYKDTISNTQVETKSSFKQKKPLKEYFQEHKELDCYGNDKATIIDYGILDKKATPSSILDYNSYFNIIMKVKFHETLKDTIFAFTIKDQKGLEITGTNTFMKDINTNTIHSGETITISFKQKANLQLGKYALSLGCVSLNDHGIEVYSRLYDCILFEIIGSDRMVGFYDLESEISIEKD